MLDTLPASSLSMLFTVLSLAVLSELIELALTSALYHLFFFVLFMSYYLHE